MPLMASEGDSKPRQQPPAGTHSARCYSVIDLGTQESQFGARHKVRLTWELPEEKAVFKEEDGEQPFVISKEYTLSLFEKANLRQDLESWRGKEFTEDERKGFDIFTLLGVPCLLTVVHKTVGDKTYANVTSASKLPKSMTCPKQINPSVQFEIDEGRSATFKELPEWLQKKIEASEEWNGGQNHPVDKKIEEEDPDFVPF